MSTIRYILRAERDTRPGIGEGDGLGYNRQICFDDPTAAIGAAEASYPDADRVWIEIVEVRKLHWFRGEHQSHLLPHTQLRRS